MANPRQFRGMSHELKAGLGLSPNILDEATKTPLPPDSAGPSGTSRPKRKEPAVPASEILAYPLTVGDAHEEIARLRALVEESTATATRLREERSNLRAENAILRHDLGIAQARVRDLEEMNILLREAPRQTAAPRNVPTPVPPDDPPRPALFTCFGEALPPGVGYNKGYTDAPIFDGTDREKYKNWKRAILRKLKMSACLYPTPDAGIMYMASKLDDIAADILNDAIDNGEAGDVATAFQLLDDAFEDSDEYGTALAAMDKLKMGTDDSVDTFLAKWSKLNIKLGRDKNSRPAVTEFRNKLPAAISSRLLNLPPKCTLQQLVEQARWVEQNLVQLNHAHPRDSAAKPSTAHNRAAPKPAPHTTTPTPTLTLLGAGRVPIPKLDDAAKKAAIEQNLCFRCRMPGHRAFNCPNFDSTADRARSAPLPRAASAPVATVAPPTEDTTAAPAPAQSEN